ncbi:hypothetical protein [Methylophilus aquaticus]|uniref:Uncharacterized protein n=1 Tax=Methylophilus aquaticus TaxID=1971610 RepID=A0ABT9JP93_9PROT|nr:hypothetical protein [Methylophilus aquaticus]MDP8566407.1 hypothetical protein [Methylophilus aquaticus]
MNVLRIGGGLLLLLVFALAGLYGYNLYGDDGPVPPSALSQAINQCDLIASKAAANLPEVLPFQKLEKAARQARVLDQCMQDQGFQENPDWVRAAMVKSAHIAKQQQISEGEAYEKLRREEMLQGTASDHPLYWRKRL